jgi:hypothetical protein
MDRLLFAKVGLIFHQHKSSDFQQGPHEDREPTGLVNALSTTVRLVLFLIFLKNFPFKLFSYLYFFWVGAIEISDRFKGENKDTPLHRK